MSGRLFLIFVIAAIFAAILFGLRAAFPLYRQRMAIAEIERLGGTVLQVRSVPTWLQKVFGEEGTAWMNQVLEVNLHDSDASDSTLALLVAMTGLEEIDVDGTKVTDVGIATLSRIASLQTISLARTEVSDTGLERLAQLKGLRLLYVARTNVTDEGVSQLKRALPGIEIWKLAERESGRGGEIYRLMPGSRTGP